MQNNYRKQGKRSCVHIACIPKLFQFNRVLNLCLCLVFFMGCDRIIELDSLPTWIYCCVILPSGIRLCRLYCNLQLKRWVKLTRHLYLCSCETTTTECVEKNMWCYNCLWFIIYDVKHIKFNVISSVIIYMLLLFIFIYVYHTASPL